ncbi:MAG: T9SS type A sorting domain-containing protein [Chitinophagales bacterium]
MKKHFILLGMLAITAVQLMAQPCTKLFFSEYIEGTSNNKALEIYNPTTVPVNLSTYKILQFRNGAQTPSSTTVLSGTIAPSGTFVIAHPQADSVNIRLKAQMLSGNMNFNGDDAEVLVSGVDTIDVIGIRRDSAVWTVDTADTKDNTLIRKASIQEGDVNWATAKLGWTAYPVNYFANLGMHTMTPCAPPADTTAGVGAAAASVAENSGNYTLTIFLNQAASSTKTVDVVYTGSPNGGSGADIGNFTSATATFNAGATSATVSIPVTDDAIPEGDEVFNFSLRNPSAGLQLRSDSLFALTILLSDSVLPGLPFYQIVTIHGEDQTTFVADSNNVHCIIGGVVYGINYRKSGLGFYINDHTGGIYVFSPSKTFGYAPTEGDSVVVSGKVSQFFGMTEFQFLDTVIKVSSGNGLLNPIVLSQKPIEDQESYLVRVNGLTYTSGWTNTGSGFTVKASKGGSTYFIRIDSLTSAYGTAAPSALFDVIGLVSQYDTGAPYDFGYDINVRRASDIIRNVGINDINELNAAVYPNPTNGQLYVNTMSDESADLEVRLFGIAGQEVYATRKSLAKGENRMLFDLSQIGNGLYILELQSGNKVSRSKVQIIR